MISLVKPDIKYRAQYIEMIDEWKSFGEKAEPWVLQVDYSDFNAMVLKFEQISQGINIPEGFVPSSTFWAYEDETDQIVGAVNIRHYLNDMLMKAWGNIGYGVRPSERRRGFATQILHLAVNECRCLNIKRALLGCYKENIASSKTILKNGGVLENEIKEEDTGRMIQRYWISI